MKATDSRGRPGGSAWGLVLQMTWSCPSGAGVRELCVYVSGPMPISAYICVRELDGPLCLVAMGCCPQGFAVYGKWGSDLPICTVI